MSDQGNKYETRTVKCVRGMESRTATRWEQDGWEVVSQEQGKLQSTLVIRRPVRTMSRRALAIGGGVAAALVVVIVLGATGVFGDDDRDDDVVADPTAVKTSAVSAPAVSPTASSAPAVVTAENTPAFAALLQLTDQCDPSIGAFAEQYAGRTVSFDGSIGTMNNHGSYTTRYDILVGAGDYSATTSRGPAFQFQDVNTTFDMHYRGDAPDTIGTGTNLGVTAEVGEYSSQQCLLRLTPVATTVR
ncbi:DUF4839 domain-containing protein [Curtobacterium sp. 179-B 9B NHS]|uniref:DUF4839 domain-containing protein n=1 Tax=Curtobacterium sp. 179-B 9B NHS TaxID=3374293 RepID=UPI00387A44D5